MSETETSDEPTIVVQPMRRLNEKTFRVGRTRICLFRLTRNKFFELFIFVCIILNCVTMIVENSGHKDDGAFKVARSHTLTHLPAPTPDI